MHMLTELLCAHLDDYAGHYYKGNDRYTRIHPVASSNSTAAILHALHHRTIVTINKLHATTPAKDSQ